MIVTIGDHHEQEAIPFQGHFTLDKTQPIEQETICCKLHTRQTCLDWREAKMHWGRLVGLVSGSLLLLAMLIFFGFVPAYMDRNLNRVLAHQSYPVSAQARELHQSLLIADLHADSLLWNRDLLASGGPGHVDLPRLIEGNVALQVFTTVTKSPRGMNLESNDGSTFDNITLLAVAQLWPPWTWGSLNRRAVYQSEKLGRFHQSVRGRHPSYSASIRCPRSANAPW